MFKSWTRALFIVSLIAAAPMAISPAGAQPKCTDEVIVGEARATKDQGEVFKDADAAWEKNALAKLGAKTVYHVEPRVKCFATRVSVGASTNYSCTVTAKACDGPPPTKRRATALMCHASAGGCEICCHDPRSGRTFCRPQCL